MSIFFNSWESLLRVLVTVLFAYPGLIIIMRVYGKRSLAKLNMFDFIITVALGSVFASIVVSENVTIMDGVIAFSLLLTAQFIVTWSAMNWSMFDKLIKSEPTIVFRDGEFIEKRMKDVRVTKEEILAEIRQKGIASLDDVYAVVMETNGMMSVLTHPENVSNSTLVGVQGADINSSNKGEIGIAS